MAAVCHGVIQLTKKYITRLMPQRAAHLYRIKPVHRLWVDRSARASYVTEPNPFGTVPLHLQTSCCCCSGGSSTGIVLQLFCNFKIANFWSDQGSQRIDEPIHYSNTRTSKRHSAHITKKNVSLTRNTNTNGNRPSAGRLCPQTRS